MKIKKVKTNFPGVRYREHLSRKHKNAPDKYYFIRYRIDGKNKEEGLGWASEGMTASSASETLSELKKANRTGVGERTLSERKKNRVRQEEENVKSEEKHKKERITFDEVWEKYFSHAKENKKHNSWASEQGLYNNWIKDEIGNMPLIEITPFKIEGIKRNLKKNNKSNRTIEYSLAVIRQVYNYAIKNKISNTESPTKHVKSYPLNNKRTRYLKKDEAYLLLNSLKESSQTTYEMALMSLYCGLRAGEIFNIEWNDIDFKNESIMIKDAKGHKTRFVPYFHKIKLLLLEKYKSRDVNRDHVFADTYGNKIRYISKTFERKVKELGLNAGIVDARHKIVFHSLRHTYASWIAENGGDLYAISKLLGHSNITVTERYAHLSNEFLKKQAKLIEDATTDMNIQNTKVIDTKSNYKK